MVMGVVGGGRVGGGGGGGGLVGGADALHMCHRDSKSGREGGGAQHPSNMQIRDGPDVDTLTYWQLRQNFKPLKISAH